MKRVLKRIIGPKKERERGDWRKLYKEKGNKLCISIYIFRVFKSRRMN